MEVLMHGHHNTLLSVMPLAVRLAEIEQKPVGEQALRKHLIQSIPLESLPPEFRAVVEALDAWDEVAKVWSKARDDAGWVWNEALDEARAKARDKTWSKAWASDKVWDVAIKMWDKALNKVWDDEVAKALDEARNNFTRLCTLHKGTLEALHAEVCLAKYPDCPWDGERLVGIGELGWIKRV